MRKLIEKQAPNINLHAVPYIIENCEQVLNDAEVDIVIGITTSYSANIRSRYLFDSKYVCAMRSEHPLAKSKLSLTDFANADHLFVSLSGDGLGITDQILHQHGLSRRIAMTVNNFASTLPLLEDTDLISVLPEGAVHKHALSGKIWLTTCPVDIPNTSISMLWHKRQDHDAGLHWLREHIANKLVSRWKENLAGI